MVSRRVGGQSPPTRRDERESARSEGRRAGASKRLFESLPELAKRARAKTEQNFNAGKILRSRDMLAWAKPAQLNI